MHVDELLNLISECDVLRDDIDDIRARIELTRAENGRFDQAVTHLAKAKSILIDLFPKIKSLDEEVREDLRSEIGDGD
jgi:hypothetical protein